LAIDLANQRLDFAFLRKPPERLLGKHEIAIAFDLEQTTAAADDLNFSIWRYALQNLPRTAGSRFVVSNAAIFDTELHSDVLLGACLPVRMIAAVYRAASSNGYRMT
jgi:hypothetical protein